MKPLMLNRHLQNPRNSSANNHLPRLNSIVQPHKSSPNSITERKHVNQRRPIFIADRDFRVWLRGWDQKGKKRELGMREGGKGHIIISILAYGPCQNRNYRDLRELREQKSKRAPND